MINSSGKRKLIRDISANTVQTVITQFFGLVIFYFMSRYLPKNDFGEYNWSMAVGFTVIAVTSFGLDLVLVKRIASGVSVMEIGGIHFFHTITVSFILVLAGLGLTLLPSFRGSHPLFFIVFLNVLVINITNSLKLCLNGLDSYRHLAILSLVTNVAKFLLVLYLYFTFNFEIVKLILAFLASSVLELALAYYLLGFNIRAPLRPVLKIKEYKQFILESLPQLGVVIFDSALSRMDIVLLGILSTTAITGEYSFVYKVYELSKLPLLIIGPVLLTRLSKLFSHNKEIDEKQKKEIRFFFKLEMFIILLIPIFLISTWSPLVDHFTNGKYGAVNETKYWLLSICVPLVCIVNFMWTLGFVQGQLKVIMFITIAVSALNIIANLVLIPFFGGLGSAVAFLICTVIQVLLYIRFIDQRQIKFYMRDSAGIFICAAIAVVSTKLLTNNIIFTPIISIIAYTGMIFITRQLSLKQIKQMLYRS
jgi:O-antigen/teichoic acid export membrane protein